MATITRLTRPLLLLLPLLLLTNSCLDDRCLVHCFHKVKNDGWKISDTLVYDLPPAPESGLYTISVEMRTGQKFLYRGVYVAMERNMQSPCYQHCDTVCFLMARDSIHMDSHGSTIQTFQHPVLNITLRKGQSGQIRLHHLMSREVLPDIREVGVRVVKSYG